MQNLDSSHYARLEQQLEALLTVIQQLKNENGLLRQQVTRLLHEKSALIHKNQTAQQRLSHLVTRLKAEIKS